MAPRSRSAGFTLIEMMITVVIIGILAIMMVPKWQLTVGKANTSALRTDLHNLVTAQEQHYFEAHTYTSDVAALNFHATKGVGVTFTEATATGWAATVTHLQANPITCGVYYGSAAAPLAATTKEGQIACE